MNTPLPPLCAKGAVCNLSPVVLMMTISASTPVASRIFLRTNSACHLASMLPRVPIRIGFTASAPGPAETVREWLRPAVFYGANLFRLASGERDQEAFFPGDRRSELPP